MRSQKLKRRKQKTSISNSIKNSRKTIGYLFLCLCLIIPVFSLPIPIQAEEQDTAVTFSELNADEVFLKQTQAHVCTLTASAMMIRRAAMLSGDKNWRDITEASVRKTAWTEGTGLKWNFTSAGISVTHKTLSSTSELITMLGKHPEGIVIYNPRKPHAILVTDYTDGKFYVSDPSNGSPSGRYPDSLASMGAESATRCWYVKNPTGLVVLQDDAVHTSENLTYVVLDETEQTVSCAGLVKNSATVNIPDTVVFDGKEYKVVKISESAFSNNTKIKSVTIGENVIAIEENAFYQCTKLKSVTIYAKKLRKIGDNAFGNIAKKAQILMLGNQVESYTPLLKAASMPTGAKVAELQLGDCLDK